MRQKVYNQAFETSRALGRPLLVVGAPDSWSTGGYPCGDITVDIETDSVCPTHYQLDVTKRLPFDDNSVVVFVSCVLEYVSDYDAALAELMRISGGYLYNVRVEPWTLTAYLYPGRRRITPNMGLSV